MVESSEFRSQSQPTFDEVTNWSCSVEASVECDSLVALLLHRAQRQPHDLAYSFLLDGEAEEAHLTYGELDRKARAIGAWLQAARAFGKRALLLYPPGLDYIAAFFGCLYAGTVAVPAYPPRKNRNTLRLEAIVTDAQATLVLTTMQALSRMESVSTESRELKALQWQATNNLSDDLAEHWQEANVSKDTLAFLQYTSGSTSQPKGVMVTHGNLLHNQRLIQQTFRQTEKSVIVGWLPLYHDMGLIGNVLQPLYVGARCILMSPIAFLQRPMRWLNAISRYRATTSGGPNFAYELCVRKSSEGERAALDLSSWEVAFNGAEPIHQETLEQFATAFSSSGFRHESFSPCYGLAEATLLVSGAVTGVAPVIKAVRADRLEVNLAVPPTADEEGRMLVSSGRTLPGQKVLIVNPVSQTRCAPSEIGEIWLSGPSVTQGYWNRPEETQQTFHARLLNDGEESFLRTGDLGFLQDGELFVTGRLKNLIIIRGLNHYPQDIEYTVERAHPDLRRGAGAAFSVAIDNEERLVVTQEVELRRKPDFDVVMENIRQAVAENHEVQVYAIALLKAGSIPKTSSGKIQHHVCRQAFLDGGLRVLAEWRDTITSEPKVAALATSPGSVEEIEDWLVLQFASTLRLVPSEIDVNAPVVSYALDSLMAIELMHSIESSLGIILPIGSFLENKSIAQLALEAQARLLALPPATAVETFTEGVTNYPLSRGQQALWFLYELAPDSRAYNISAVLRIRADLQVRALRQAFQTLIDQHPSLRTTFTAPHGEPVQQIFERLEVCFQEVNASTWDEASLEQRLIDEAHHKFNLEQGPLLRVTLFTRSSQEYIVLLAVHHIVADFWSLAVLTHQLGMLYEAEVSGMQPALVPQQFHYRDYVRLQEQELVGPEEERLWTYWQERLGGELPGLNLPTDNLRPAVQTYVGASQAFELDADLTGKLKMLARANGATLYMMLLAAFQVLLFRYTGQEDLLVGSPTAGRNRARWAGVVGYFVNPIVLRADLSGGPTFKAFLQQVRRSVLDAFEHQDYPFPMLVERLQPTRDPSRSPIFQVMFALQKTHVLNDVGLASFALGETGARVELGGLALESMALQQRVAQFDLTLLMVETGNNLSASLQYNTDLFEEASISRMVEHFGKLLENIVLNPEQQIDKLGLLSDLERAQLVVGYNDTRTAYPRGCLHELFEAQVARTPEATALIFEDEQISYEELNEKANQLAHHLRSLGVGPEVLVGILMERSVEMVISLLAVLKAGGAYVPLDPSYPRERLRFTLQDAAVQVLLTQERLSELADGLAKDLALRVVTVDAEEELIREESTDNVNGETMADHAAYVIYTSGSTGKPKGVVISHSSAVILSHWAKEVFTEEDFAGVLASTSISFDLSIYELFVPLSWGGTVILAENALQLPDLPAAKSVTLINTVPSAMAELLRLKAVPDSVRTVNLAGEPLQHSLVRDVYELGTVQRVFNLYGPTEDTTYSTFALIKPDDKVPSIGEPIGNTEVYVLDEHHEPLPLGVAGELYLGGEGLARGYYGRPDLTAELFIPDGLSGRAGGRLYRTGDLGRRLGDGSLEYLGRVDHQVKVRGYRIELGEVEAVLGQHEQVREAVVVARGGVGSAEQRLVAYVVAEAGASVRAGELRRHAREQLPDYMVPTAYVLLEELPLTPNGKVDRKALPEVGRTPGEMESESVGPRTATEQAVAEVWAEVLSVERVGVHQNFFELGGHSLLATQVVSRLRDIFQIEIPLRRVFERPTVESLAQIIDEENGNASKLVVPALVAVAREAHRVELPLQGVLELPDVLKKESF